MNRSFPLLLTLALAACSEQPTPTANDGGSTAVPGTPGASQPSTPTGSTNPTITVDSRDEWMRPDVIMGMMNNDVSGMTIADLFAGDGYFTFRLVQGGAKVIAVDTDPANIAKLEARKKELGLTDEQLVIRQVAVGDPGLKPNEADAALLVHGFASIPDKEDYFKRMRAGMRDPRPLLMIDWQDRQTPVGPPPSERLPTEVLMEQLGALGYTDVGAHSDKLPYQVVFFATDPMDTAQ